MSSTYDASDARPGPIPEKRFAMTFGKHAGKPIDEVPHVYVVWLLVGPNTEHRYKCGNYEWIKQNTPDLFKALKERLVSDIREL